MIMDSFERFSVYFGDKLKMVQDHFATVSEDIKEGRIDFANGIYANVESYITDIFENCRPEAHRIYCDIHFILTGDETILCLPNHKLNVFQAYDNEKDIEFYHNHYSLSGVCTMNITKGQFIFFWPWDIHIPHVAFEQPAKIKKIVYKIPCQNII